MLTKTARYSFSLNVFCLLIVFCLTAGATSNKAQAQETRLNAQDQRSAAQEERARAAFSFPILNLAEDPRELSAISVKLNDHDVSLFARHQPGFVQINLPTPLKQGMHHIFIQAEFKNGDVATLLQKRFVLNEQKQTMGKSALNLKPSVSFTEYADAESSDNKLENTLITHTGEGKEQYQAADLEHMLPLMKFDSQDQAGDQASAIFLRTGDHLIDQQGLVFANYQRNGLSAGISDTTRQYQAQVFAFHDSQMAEQYDGFQAPGQQERSVGALASYSPLAQPELFTIATAYLRGEKSETFWDAQNVYQEQTLYGGNNWNVSMDSQLLNKALMIKSEYAWSQLDHEQAGSASEYQRNSAWKTTAEWHAHSKRNRWLFNEWRLGVEVQEIDPEFWSVGNHHLPADLYSEKLYFVGSYSDFNLTAEMIREQNNVEANPLLPDQQSGFLNINWFFTPSRLDAHNPLWNLFGQPSFNGHAHFSEHDQDDEDVYIAGYDVDRHVDEYHISANFHKPKFHWSLQHSQTLMDDRTVRVEENGLTFYEPASDSINYLTGLTLGINPTEQLYLGFLVQLNLLKEEQSGNQFSNLNFGLDSRYELVPNKWSLNLNYTINENDHQFKDEFDSNSHYRDQSINLHAELKMLKPRAVSPGLNVFFKGSYLHQEETTTNNTEEHFKVQVGATLHWNKNG